MTATRHRPDAAELGIRALLRERGVGPDAEQLPALPPAADLPPGYTPAAWSWDAYFASDTLRWE
jgi:hypothetical protein